MALAAAIIVPWACGGSTGSGRVQAHFYKDECGPGDPQNLMKYGFDAAYLVTERFGGILTITIQRYRASLEESDGLAIRLDVKSLMKRGLFSIDTLRGQIVRSDPTRAADIKTSTDANDANVTLSLFETCPNFPTSMMSAGLVSLDKVTLAEDPGNTGENERLAGTVTGTLTRLNEDGPVGTLDVIFDFAPPRRPLVANQ